MIIKKAVFKCDGTQEFTEVEVPDDYFGGDETGDAENAPEPQTK